MTDADTDAGAVAAEFLRCRTGREEFPEGAGREQKRAEESGREAQGKVKQRTATANDGAAPLPFSAGAGQISSNTPETLVRGAAEKCPLDAVGAFARGEELP